MKIIQKIAKDKIFQKKPMVLMHLGSSGSNFSQWRNIANSSILITLDGNIKNNLQNHNFKKIINKKVIISNKNGRSNFYETKDPHCSSLLQPDKKIYTNWYGAHRFKIRKKVKTKVLSIDKFLKENKINYIDWLIIDIQGMDLKIIKNLKKKIRSNISIIDIEAGFFPFYKKEGKISEIFNYFSEYFDFEDMKFGYNFKVNSKNITNFEKKLLYLFNEPSKIYSNMTFLNKNDSKRNILLKMIYLTQKNKLFEVREIINKKLKSDKHYKKLQYHIKKEINFKKLKFIFFAPILFLKKIFNYNVD